MDVTEAQRSAAPELESRDVVDLLDEFWYGLHVCMACIEGISRRFAVSLCMGFPDVSDCLSNDTASITRQISKTGGLQGFAGFEPLRARTFV